MNHAEVVKRFAERRINKRKGDVFWHGLHISCSPRVINSYGWWPMAYWLADSLFLKQGDRYSVSTGAHQGLIQSYCDGPTVSFSALQSAGIRPEEISALNIVDWHPDTQIELERSDTHAPWRKRGEDRPFKPPAQGMLIKYSWEENRAYWHILGACLIRWQGNQYLCSMDERAYFVAQLGKKADTVKDAFQFLKPPQVEACRSAGVTVVRQGEWFFVDTGMSDREVARANGWTIRQLRRVKSSVGPLPRTDPGSNAHQCRQLRLSDDANLATGCVRHPEHRMLRLGKTWWRVHRNTEVTSWSQGGRFD